MPPVFSVNYLMSGPAHLPYLAVSLASLRRWYAGPVVVWAYPNCQVEAAALAGDSRIRAQYRDWTPIYEGKNGQFINKIQVMMNDQTSDGAVYLDADTLIAGSLTEMFEAIVVNGFVATQFNQWDARSGVIQNRVKRLLGRQPIPQEAVQSFLDSQFTEGPDPSVNGGVWGCTPKSVYVQEILKKWMDWTMAVKDIFIADETVLHALMSYQFDQTPSRFEVMRGGRWNCSPKHQPSSLCNADVKIWHFHGDCNVRPEKSKRGVELWWPEYLQVLEDNIGRIQEWKNSYSSNQYLKELERTRF